MKYFIDTEFNQEGPDVELITLGIVREDEQKFYAFNTDINLTLLDDWLQKNVVANLRLDEAFHGTPKDIKEKLFEWLQEDKTPWEFWGYYADYDWFLLTRLWGSFLKLPDKLPYLCYDVRQYMKHVGMNDMPSHKGTLHNALDDAEWTRRGFEKVRAATRDLWP